MSLKTTHTNFTYANVVGNTALVRDFRVTLITEGETCRGVWRGGAGIYNWQEIQANNEIQSTKRKILLCCGQQANLTLCLKAYLLMSRINVSK